jgi:hypothetical protein
MITLTWFVIVGLIWISIFNTIILIYVGKAKRKGVWEVSVYFLIAIIVAILAAGLLFTWQL